MKKFIIGLALILSLTSTAFAGLYGGGFSSSSRSTSSFSSGSSFRSYSSPSYSSGFNSSYHSSGSFSTPKSTSTYSGGLSKPTVSTGVYKSSGTATPAPVKSTPRVTTTKVGNTTYTTSNYNQATHNTYVSSHPYGYWMNPFSSNWFIWWFIFGNNNRPASENKTTIINCTPTKEVPCPTTSTVTTKK